MITFETNITDPTALRKILPVNLMTMAEGMGYRWAKESKLWEKEGFEEISIPTDPSAADYPEDANGALTHMATELQATTVELFYRAMQINYPVSLPRWHKPPLTFGGHWVDGVSRLTFSRNKKKSMGFCHEINIWSTEGNDMVAQIKGYPVGRKLEPIENRLRTFAFINPSAKAVLGWVGNHIASADVPVIPINASIGFGPGDLRYDEMSESRNSEIDHNFLQLVSELRSSKPLLAAYPELN